MRAREPRPEAAAICSRVWYTSIMVSGGGWGCWRRWRAKSAATASPPSTASAKMASRWAGVAAANSSTTAMAAFQLRFSVRPSHSGKTWPRMSRTAAGTSPGSSSLRQSATSCVSSSRFVVLPSFWVRSASRASGVLLGLLSTTVRIIPCFAGAATAWFRSFRGPFSDLCYARQAPLEATVGVLARMVYTRVRIAGGCDGNADDNPPRSPPKHSYCQRSAYDRSTSAAHVHILDASSMSAAWSNQG